MGSVFVTGATGFVGRALVERLLGDGLEVIAAGRRPHQSFSGRVRWTAFDLERADELDPKQLEQVDCVYHLAARVHLMHPTAADAERFELLNVRGTRALGRMAIRAGVPRFVFVSSVKVHGERTSTEPFATGQEPQPRSAYARSKLQAEECLHELQSDALSVVSVRPPLIYGPHVGANFRRLLSLVRSGIPLPLGAVDNRRSMVSVWNLTDLLARAGHHTAADGTWLVSDGEDVSTPQLMHTIASAMGRRARLWNLPTPILRAAGACIGQSAQMHRLLDSLQVDISRTCDRFDWRPPVPFAEGIARTVRWFLESCDK